MRAVGPSVMIIAYHDDLDSAINGPSGVKFVVAWKNIYIYKTIGLSTYRVDLL